MEVRWEEIIRELANEITSAFSNIIVRKCDMIIEEPSTIPGFFATKTIDGIGVSKRRILRDKFVGLRPVPDNRRPTIKIGFSGGTFIAKIEVSDNYPRKHIETKVINTYDPTNEGIKDMQEFIGWWAKKLDENYV